MLGQIVEAASFYHICSDLVSPWRLVLQEAGEPACGPLGSQSSPSGKRDLWSGWQDFSGLKYLQSPQLCWAQAVLHRVWSPKVPGPCRPRPAPFPVAPHAPISGAWRMAAPSSVWLLRCVPQHPEMCECEAPYPGTPPPPGCTGVVTREIEAFGVRQGWRGYVAAPPGAPAAHTGEPHAH